MSSQPLTSQQLADFHAQGFLLVPGLVPPVWLEEIRRDLAGLHERMAVAATPGVHVSWEHEVDPTVHRRIKQLMHAELVSPALDRLVRSPHVLDIVEQLLGPNISLYHCKLLMKAAREGTVTPWHQDYSYWEMDGNRPLQLNCMVAIDDADAENGCIQFVPGSHRQGLLPHDRDSRPFGRYLPGYFQPRPDAVPLAMPAGSGVFFGPLVIHGSDANRSAKDRRAVTTAYNVTGNQTSFTRGVLRGAPC